MIAVLGAGAFGSALALTIPGKVHLWGRSLARGATSSKRLPEYGFKEHILVTETIEDACKDADAILLAVPMAALRETAEAIPVGATPLIACCKGINPSTSLGPVSTLRQMTSNPVGILTGPSFASDIAARKPTALALGMTEVELAKDLQRRLSGPTLRLYRSDDLRGLELGGALKNVLAIGAGAIMGAGLGQSAQAALITRGLTEMLTLAEAMGARRETLLGLSGIGDLMLTAFSPESRNYRYGLALGLGEEFSEDTTVEGVTTARAVAKLAQDNGVSAPILEATHGLISGQLTIKTAVEALMSRPLKEE